MRGQRDRQELVHLLAWVSIYIRGKWSLSVRGHKLPRVYKETRNCCFFLFLGRNKASFMVLRRQLRGEILPKGPQRAELLLRWFI